MHPPMHHTTLRDLLERCLLRLRLQLGPHRIRVLVLDQGRGRTLLRSLTMLSDKIDQTVITAAGPQLRVISNYAQPSNMI